LVISSVGKDLKRRNLALDFAVGPQPLQPVSRLSRIRPVAVVLHVLPQGLRRILIAADRYKRLRDKQLDLGSFAI
jgi:hypothetical protein